MTISRETVLQALLQMKASWQRAKLRITSSGTEHAPKKLKQRVCDDFDCENLPALVKSQD